MMTLSLRTITSLLRSLMIASFLLAGALANAQWVVGDSSGTVMVYKMIPYGNNGYMGISDRLYVSTDAGATWEVRIPTLNTFPLQGLFPGAHFTDESNGIFAGCLGSLDQYAILRTTDGGLTWSNLDHSNNGAWPRQYHDLHFPSQNVGYAAGTNGRIMKTTNGGNTWTLLTPPALSTITSVHFTTDNIGVIAGDNMILRTTNGGTSWNSVLSVTGEHVMNAVGNTLVVAGEDVVHISTDAGITWTTRPSPAADPSDVHVFSGQHFVVIDDILDKAFLTTSGGLYWEEIVMPVSGHLSSVHFRSPLSGCIGGKRQWNRSLIFTTNNGSWDLLPVVGLSSSQTAQCGSVVMSFQAVGAAPNWSVQWFQNDTLIGTGPAIDVEFTATTGSAGVELHVSNGNQTTILPWNTGVTVVQPFTIDAGSDHTFCAGNSIQLSVTGPPNTSYSWSPGTGLNNPTSASPTVTGLTAPVTYTVTATQGPCTSTEQVFIDVVPEIADEDWIELITGNTLGIFAFPDPYNGFMSSGGIMHRTHDGGSTWQQVPGPNITSFSVGRLQMVDAFYGYASAGYTMYRTTDGWNSYSPVSLPIANGNSYEHVYTRGRDTAIVWLNQNPSPSKLLRTMDGGNHWELVHSSIGAIMDIVWLNDTIILAGGGTGIGNARLFRSDDAGASWNQIQVSTIPIAIADLEVAADGTVYAVNGPHLYSSTDQGLTWEHMLTNPTTTLYQGIGAVTFQGPDTGYATIGGALYRTVNGGACWQQMGSSSISGPFFRITSTGHYTFVQGSSGQSYILYRDEMPPPGLAFTLYGDTICSGNDQIAVNNSIGFSNYEWYLDGVLISSDVQPQFSNVASGSHTLQLVGYLNGGTQSLSKPFFVDAYEVTPVLVLPTSECWVDGMISITAVTPAPAIGQQWFTVGGGDNLFPINAGGNVLTVNGSTNPYAYVSRPISPNGCPGHYSEPVTPPIMPWLSNTSGPQNICLPGMATTEYSVTANSNSNIQEFEWVLSPPEAGVPAPNGNNCSINWDQEFSGQVVLRVRAANDCGFGPFNSQWPINLVQSAVITQQPEDVYVDLGQPFSLSVQVDGNVNNTGWHRNGLFTGQTTPVLSIASASQSDAGAYYWRGWQSSACGWLHSDTVQVIVLDPLGVGTSAHAGMPRIFPNPFNEQLHLSIPEDRIVTGVVLADVTGRRILERDLSAGDKEYDLVLPALAPGTYHIQLIGPGLNYSTILFKQDQ
jgi:photosystem II stability/assembly factor-like uncharacterized protein